MRIRGWMKAVQRSAVTWPVTLFWVAAAATTAAVAEGMFTWIQAVILLLAFAVFLIACSIKQQITQVQRLVNGERHELIQERDRLARERDTLLMELAAVKVRSGRA